MPLKWGLCVNINILFHEIWFRRSEPKYFGDSLTFHPAPLTDQELMKGNL